MYSLGSGVRALFSVAAGMEAYPGAGYRADTLVIIVLALMPHGQQKHFAVIDDLKQDDVAGVAKIDDQLAKEWIEWFHLATSKGEFFQHKERPIDSIHCSAGSIQVVIHSSLE